MESFTRTYTLLQQVSCYTNFQHTGVGQCACTTEIKQLWEKMDRVQDNVAANNASSQGTSHANHFALQITGPGVETSGQSCMCWAPMRS